MQLSGYSGRTLPPQELLAVDSHLASCDVCHERLTRILPAVAKRVISQSFESGGASFHLDYEQHLEPYVDGKADDIDREIVDSHVALCTKCATDLKDLLAFKQQPAVATGGAGVTSSWWKRWLPQRQPLSTPALAMAVVIAVFILAMAVFLFTRNPASQSGQQAELPLPAATAHTTQPNSNQPQGNGSDLPTTPREEPLIALNDAGGQVIVNQRGQLEGLQELPPDLKESVERALASRQLRASPALTGWPTGAGTLRGRANTSTFAPLEPTDVVIETDRPSFRWQALAGADHYVVTIYDGQLREVGRSDPVTGTEWTTPNSLARGITYSWQISATKDGEKFVSPKPPLAEARFRILDQRAVAALAKLKEYAGSSHLVMGVFYWKHGLIEKSEREFQALARANPNSTAAAELLASIRSLRRR